MTENERIQDWARMYRAAVPSYKAEALRAVWINDQKLFRNVVAVLKLDLNKLMEDMTKEK